jgi:hypothetical protein
LTALAAAAAIATAGCGVSGGSGAGIEALVLPAGATGSLVSQAAEQTGDVRTQRVSLVVTVTDDAGGSVATISAEGAYDLEANVGELTSTASAGAGVDLETDVVYDGEDVYVRAGLLDLFTGGRPWLRVPVGEVSEVADALEGSILADPGSFLDLLEAAGGPLEDLGTENVRGVPTRHVGVDLDVAALLAEVAPEQAEELEAQLERLDGSAVDVEAIPAQAWIDAQGYVRRFTISVTPDGTTGMGATVTQTIELWGFDEPVDVDVPSPSEVRDLDELAEGLLGD